MNEDIEFLRDFINCDRYRITELIDSLSQAMQKIGHLLRQRAEGPFTLVYHDENDPMYELAQLLDGNNFEVYYGFSFLGLSAAKITPIYMETIEVKYDSEEPLSMYVPETKSYTKSASEETPEVRNPSRRRGLRAKMLLIDDALFDEYLKKPPQRKGGYI